jgi:hypothetical protein
MARAVLALIATLLPCTVPAQAIDGMADGLSASHVDTLPPAAGPPFALPDGTTPLTITIGGGSFSPGASTLTYQTIGGAIHVTALPPGGLSLQADVGLPIGAAITAVRFYVVDNDSSAFGFNLVSYDPLTDARLFLLSAASVGASTAVQTVNLVPATPIVVDGSVGLRLRVQPGIATSAHLLRGARIEYLPPTVFQNGFETAMLLRPVAR